jgi:hypothetical protein
MDGCVNEWMVCVNGCRMDGRMDGCLDEMDG